MKFNREDFNDPKIWPVSPHQIFQKTNLLSRIFGPPEVYTNDYPPCGYSLIRLWMRPRGMKREVIRGTFWKRKSDSRWFWYGPTPSIWKQLTEGKFFPSAKIKCRWYRLSLGKP